MVSLTRRRTVLMTFSSVGALSTVSIISAISSMRSSLAPRVVMAGVPRRIPEVLKALRESKGIVQERLQEVEARIAELQSMQRSLQRLNDACCGTAHSSVYCSILEALEQGASGVKSGC